MTDQLNFLAGSLIDTASNATLTVACAESCTGGWIAKAITDQAGSSVVFDCGVVTYSNRAKAQLLGVPATLIEAVGAVSREVAEAMATGLLERTSANLVVATTGVAGPGGGTEQKPVGTVWIAWAKTGGNVEAVCRQYSGNRDAVREQTVADALIGLKERCVNEEQH
jgi:nicotinamide-nucleotide amidase